MSDQTIFDQTNTQPVTPATQTNQPSPSDNVADLLKLIVNDKGEPKYKTIQDALVGLQHANAHIQTLVTEKRQVEQEKQSLQTAAEKVAELERVVAELTKTPPQATPAAVDPTQIQELVSQAINANKTQEVQKQNTAVVVNAAKQVFGEKAEEMFYSRAQDVGLSREQINTLAASSPQAAMKILGLASQSGSSTPTQKTVMNTTEAVPNQDTFISRNTERLPVGATFNEMQRESIASKKMVEELAAKGMSIDDLTKPSNYFKHFK